MASGNARTSGDVQTVIDSARKRIRHSDIPIPRDTSTDTGRPPGPGRSQVLRNMYVQTRAPWFMVELEREFPTITHFTFAGMHRYLVNSPEIAVAAFLDHAHDVIKGPAYDSLKAFVGNGLLTAEGPTHLAHRRLAQPAFHRERIGEYSQAMIDLALALDQSWRDGEAVDMSMEMTELTLTIVGRTLFGVDISQDAEGTGQALKRMLQVAGRYVSFGPAIWRYPSPIRTSAATSLSTVDSVVNRIIAEHRATGDTGDILSLLLAAKEDGDEFTDEQVRDEIVTLVIAGHETTAMSLTWSWMLLAQNPEQREWLHEELDSVLGGRPPTMDDIPNLPRTHAVIAEALRLYTPVWMYGRRALVDMELGGWTVPAGSNIMASPFAMHRSARWWPDADTFQPTRWINDSGAFDERQPDVPRGAWMPFGWGSRKCIGEMFAWTEAILLVAILAQRWAPTMAPGAVVRPESNITLRPKGGMPMVLRRR